MKRQLLFFALALAIPMSVFARSQGSSHQQVGATSHRTQQHSATSQSQFGQRQSTAQKGNAGQLRGNGTGNAAMNGTQNVGSGSMGRGPQGNMSPNGVGMGSSPMGQGYQANMGPNGNAAGGNMGQGNHGKMNPNGNGNATGNGTSMGMGQGQTVTPQQP